MTVRFEPYAIPFTSGISGKVNEKALPAPRLDTLENGVFDELGALKKRHGYTVLTNGNASARGVWAYKDQLVTATNTAFYVRNTVTNAWRNVGSWAPCRVDLDAVFGFPGTGSTLPHHQDSCRAGSVELFAWERSDKVYYVLRHTSTGAVLSAGVQEIAGSTNAKEPRCLATATTLYLFYRDGATLKYRTVVASTLVEANGNLVNAGVGTASARPIYDVAFQSTGHLVVAYYNTTPVTDGCELKRFDTTLTEVDTEFVGDGDYGIAVAVAPNDLICVVVVDTPAAGVSNVYATTHNATTLAPLGGPTDIGDVTCDTTADRIPLGITAKFKAAVNGAGGYDCYILWGHNRASTPYWGIGGRIFTTAGATSAMPLFATRYSQRSQLASRIWEDTTNSRLYVIVRSGAINPTYLAMDLTSEMFLANILPGSASMFLANNTGGGGHLPSVSFASNQAFTALLGVRAYDLTPSGTGSTYVRGDIDRSIVRTVIDTNEANTGHMVMEGESLYAAGGLLRKYDGARFVEAGFLEILDSSEISAIPAAGGSMTADSTYYYKVTADRQSPNGELEVGTTIGYYDVGITGGNQSVEMYVPCVSLTEDATNIVLSIWRTEADPGEGALYYRVGTLPNRTTGQLTATSFTDTLSDANLIARQPYRFDNGELVHTAPGAAHIIADGQRRVWLSGFQDRNKVQYSKLRGWGEPVEWNAALTVTLPEEGGPVTGIGFLGETCIVFKESRIYALTGDGVDNYGQGQEFSIRLIQADSGCIDQRSIVSTPAGLFYKSERGIYLLTYGYQCEYVGADAEDFNDQTITSAILMPDRHQVRFLCASGSALVFDYYVKQWSTFTNWNGIGACLCDGTYYHVTAAGQVRQESDSLFTDNGSDVVLKVVTGWIRVSTLQGYQRVRRAYVLGDYKSTHAMLVEVGYDYASTFDDEALIVQTAEPVQSRVNLAQQKCQAIRFRISDTSLTGTKESYALTELRLDVGVKEGGFRLSANKTSGAT